MAKSSHMSTPKVPGGNKPRNIMQEEYERKSNIVNASKTSGTSEHMGVDGKIGAFDIGIGSSPEVFVNSSALFMEYYDLLDNRWFVLVSLLARTETLSDAFDTSIFAGLDDNEVLEWYVGRHHYNPFEDIPCKYRFNTEEDRKKFLDGMAYDQMTIKELFEYDCGLNAMTILSSIMEQAPNLIKTVYIYEGLVSNPFIQARVREHVRNSKSIKFLHGNFEDCIKNINKDCTYFLADADKVETLIKMDRLEYSSILISDGWRYNYTADKAILKVSPAALQKLKPCRVMYFNNLFKNIKPGDEEMEKRAQEVKKSMK